MTKIRDRIVEPSWREITEDFSLRKFYFIPGMISVSFFSIILVYQFVYTYVVLFWNEEKLLTKLLDYLHSDYLIPTLIIWWIFLAFYVFINPLFEIAIINKLNCKSKWADVTMWEAFWKSLYSFLPVFEYSNTFNALRIVSIFNMYLFTIRFTWIEKIDYVSYFFWFLLFIWTIINLLSAFTRYIIIIEGLPLFKAFGLSSKMVLLNLRTAFKLYLLMFFLNIRVILNFIIFLGIPIAIVAAITYIASNVLFYVAIWAISIVWILLFLVISYISTTLDVFKLSIWYYAYKDSQDNLKRIEEEI